MRDDARVRARVLMCAVGLVLGLYALSLARTDPVVSFAGDSWEGAVALLAPGWALWAVGLWLWARRPGVVIGPLLIAAGAAWFVEEWDNPGAGSALVFTIGLLLGGACAPLVAWVVLAHPTGRMTSRAERATVVFGLVSGLFLLGVVPALVFDPAAGGCSTCPSNLLAVVDDPDRFVAVNRVGLGATAVAAVATIALVVWRLAHSSATRRRLVVPVALAGSAYLGVVAWTSAAAVERGFAGTGNVERRLWYAQAAALVAVPAAVAWNQMRVRRTRSAMARLVLELGEAVSEGGVRSVMATVLGDPDLLVACPMADGRHVAATGATVDLGRRDGREMTPLGRAGQVVAVLVHRPGLLDDPEAVEEVVSGAQLALETERLTAEVRLQEADLRASRARIVETSDAERRRLERDLHDGAQQR